MKIALPLLNENELSFEFPQSNLMLVSRLLWKVVVPLVPNVPNHVRLKLLFIQNRFSKTPFLFFVIDELLLSFSK